jgi:hypothetical protein
MANRCEFSFDFTSRPTWGLAFTPLFVPLLADPRHDFLVMCALILFRHPTPVFPVPMQSSNENVYAQTPCSGLAASKRLS